MKISHSSLQECLADPRGWLDSQDSSSYPAGMTYIRALKLAIHVFHTSEFDVARARSYLQDTITRHQGKGKLLNVKRIDEVEQALEAYMNWAVSEDLQVVDSNINLGDYIDVTGIPLGGLIPRIDLLVGGGYRAILIGKFAPSWQREMRMPLIQVAVSRIYGRPLGEISVGVQNVDGSDLEARIYGRRAALTAETTLNQLSRRLDSLIKRSR
jgi:hypothetical protein